MARKKTVEQSKFYCTCCGNETLPIFRKSNKKRETGHLKKLYCIHCKREVNSVEVNDWSNYNYEDFRVEFEGGNFSEEGLRKQPFRQFLNQHKVDA
jgi:hypothetical protein